MYIILTCMLALNVSSDVLNGFNRVHDGLRKSNQTSDSRNGVQYAYLQDIYEKNPIKAEESYQKGMKLRKKSAALLSSIDSLKTDIARQADGQDGDFNALKNPEDRDATSVTLLNPATNRGHLLRNKIDEYRIFVTSLLSDSIKKSAVNDQLSVPSMVQVKGAPAVAWEERMFGEIPAVAAITMLTKIQNDILQSEGEALSALITAVDIGDVRVNELNAYVIPRSNMVMRGGRYSADIVLAAVDTTSRPAIWLNGKRLEEGISHIDLPATASGEHKYSGYLEVARGDGSVTRRPFSSTYTVMEPMATISATMMNVMYAGIENPVSISVPGIPMDKVSASISSGTLTRRGNGWIAKVSKPGSEAVVSVSATIDGKSQHVGSMTFRVRKLPDPTPFIAMKDSQGNGIEYRGAPGRISKSALLSADVLGASLTDGLLDVRYSVVSFQTIFFDSMGNAMPELSNGSEFSPRQKEQIRRLKPGKMFFISNVKAKGPDGVTRDIPPMQVVVNS